MKLHDFLSVKNETRELAPFEPVEFIVVGEDRSSGAKVRAKASAVLVFVDEDKRQDCIMQAQISADAKAVNADNPEKPTGHAPPRTVVDNEFIYHLLLRALRDATNHRNPFADNVDQLRVALMKPVANKLYDQYEKFVEREFPDNPTVEQTQELEVEAEKK